jgi:hypothetical protein
VMVSLLLDPPVPTEAGAAPLPVGAAGRAEARGAAMGRVSDLDTAGWD